MANIQVVLEGKGPVTLRESNYVATGGEGTIYRISDLVVKVLHKPEEARRQGMLDKIRFLTGIKHPFISSPIGLVTSPAGEHVGHYLPFVDGHPLARVFTNEFWQKERFSFAHASTLVDRMREVVAFAHQHQLFLVDPNELNWFALLTGSDPEPRIIDVDSWVREGKIPAKVPKMPSIRDWHGKTVSRESDWFAWGVVTFQVYTGLHPFKGTLAGFDRRDLEGRMKANASVFSKGIGLNLAVRDFSKIPGRLLGWYEATFQKGERVNPPSPFDTGVAAPRAALVARTVTTGKTGALVFEKLLGLTGDPAVRTFHCGVALLSSGKLIDLGTKRQIGEVESHSCEVVKVQGGWLIAQINKKREIGFEYVRDGSLKSEKLSLKLNGYNLLGYEDRLFVVTENGLTEVKLSLFGKAIASVGQTWGAMVNSTKWFQGLGVMDAMGAKYVITPFGESAVAQVRVPELDNMQVVTAKSGNRFVSIVGLDRSGSYHKVEITFSRDYKSYKVWTGDTDGPELNLAILPKGVCATIIRDGELDIFVPSSGQVNRAEDKQIGTDMLLSNWGDKVIYIQSGEVWSIRLR